MRFFFQLNLEQVPNNIKGEFGEGILQFFYCVDCDDDGYKILNILIVQFAIAL